MSGQLEIVFERCTGCRQCELACAWVQTGMFQPTRSLMRVLIFDEEAAYAPYTCVQCDEAWCMNACPVNAIVVDRQTGAKRILSSLCIGCQLCTLACPFGAVFGEPQLDGDLATKCDLCGGQPACVASCPTRAIQYVGQELVEGERTAGSWFQSWAEQVHSGRLATEVG